MHLTSRDMRKLGAGLVKNRNGQRRLDLVALLNCEHHHHEVRREQISGKFTSLVYVFQNFHDEGI